MIGSADPVGKAPNSGWDVGMDVGSRSRDILKSLSATLRLSRSNNLGAARDVATRRPQQSNPIGKPAASARSTHGRTPCRKSAVRDHVKSLRSFTQIKEREQSRHNITVHHNKSHVAEAEHHTAAAGDLDLRGTAAEDRYLHIDLGDRIM